MKPFKIDGVWYETQDAHDWRIGQENARFKREKTLSRSQGSSPDTRLRLLRRAEDRCEICAFGMSTVLNIHHIYPVRFGGGAAYHNLIAICPNCHAIVHRFGGRRASPNRRELLIEVGYSEEAADRLLLVASLNAKVTPEGNLIACDNSPMPNPFFIVDAPDADPVKVARYWKAVEARERRAEAAWQNSHLERGRRYVESHRRQTESIPPIAG